MTAPPPPPLSLCPTAVVQKAEDIERGGRRRWSKKGLGERGGGGVRRKTLGKG